MQQYANYGGDSGVMAFESGADEIDVQFTDGWIYKYTYTSIGSSAVEELKRRALAGRGLNSYINTNRYISKGYALKWKGR